MRKNIKAAVVAGAIAVLSSVGVGAALAATSAPVPVNDPAKPVYACVSATGKVDYLEYRGPQPHACWFKGEKLYELSSGVPAPSASPSPSTSDSGSPAPTDSSSASASASASNT